VVWTVEVLSSLHLHGGVSILFLYCYHYSFVCATSCNLYWIFFFVSWQLIIEKEKKEELWMRSKENSGKKSQGVHECLGLTNFANLISNSEEST